MEPFRLGETPVRTLRTRAGTVICYADPVVPRPHTTIEKRFLSHVRQVSNGCWLWTGALDPDGYPRFCVGTFNGRPKIVLAHRWSYAHYVKAIPDGSVIEHIAEICDRVNCVNPKHLQAVRPGGGRRRKPVCRRGHQLDHPGARRPDGSCAECARERLRAHRRRQRSVATDSTSSPSTL